MSEITFTSTELSELLGHDVIPGRIANTWNSLVVNRQIASPFLMPWDSIARTESMSRLLQEGETEERVYRGRQSNLMPNDLELNARYLNISTGYGFSPSGHFEIGVSRQGQIAVPEAIGVVPPGMFFPTKEGAKQHSAATVYFDYSDRRNVEVNFPVKMSGLELSGPKTKDQASQALRIFGDFIGDLKAGISTNFETLRQRLIDEAGLTPVGEISAELTENFSQNHVPQIEGGTFTQKLTHEV